MLKVKRQNKEDLGNELVKLLKQGKLIRCNSYERGNEVFRLLHKRGIRWRTGQSLVYKGSYTHELNYYCYNTQRGKTELVISKKSDRSEYDTNEENDWLCWCEKGMYPEYEVIEYEDILLKDR